MLSKIILSACVFYLVAGSIIKDQGDHFGVRLFDIQPIEIPEQCKGKRGCTIKPEGYDKIVANIENLLPSYLKQNYTDRYSEVDNRGSQKFDENDDNNCAYVVSYQKYYSYDGMILAQIDNKFEQKIEEVRCLEEGNACFKDVVSEAFNQRSACRTVHKAYTLYTVSPDGSAIEPKVFFIPACCSCVVTN